MNRSISFCPFLGFKSDGLPLQPSNNHPLDIIDLKQAVYHQLDLKDTKKGASGCIFPFSYDRFYPIDEIEYQSSGILFSDIDHLSDEDTFMITSRFDDLCKYLPDLQGMNLSHSGNGLHLYFLTSEFSVDEYTKHAILNCIRLDKVLSKYFNINLPKKSFDHHQTSIKQRFYLNYPKDNKIYWNDLAYPLSFKDEDITKFISTYIDEYRIYEDGKQLPSIATKWDGLQYTPNTTQQDDFDPTAYGIERKNTMVPHLAHQDRMVLYNSLHAMLKDENKISTEWVYCMRNMNYPPECNSKLDYCLKEPQLHKWFKYKDPHVSFRLLSLFYNIYPCVKSKEGPLPEDNPLTEEQRELIAKYTYGL